MKGLRVALAIVALGLSAPGPAAFSQDGGVDPTELPRQPIPYGQFAPPHRIRPRSALAARTRTARPQPRPAAPGVSAKPATAPRGPAGPGSPAAGPTQPTVRDPPRSRARLSPSDPIPAAELEAYVDGLARESMSTDHVAGLVVSVVQNGQPVLQKGYGEAVLTAPGRPGVPVDPRTSLFRLGSVSEVFTALETMKAVEQGRLRLDLPINIYLPPSLRIPDDDVKRPILVRHLLTQTAGFENRALGRRFVDDPVRLLSGGAAFGDRAPRRVFAPGELATQSDFGTSLLGVALANTLRKPFDDLMDADLFTPLRLSSTTFREPYPARARLPAPMSPALAGRLSQGYRWTRRGFEPVAFEYAQTYAPALSASTTAVDMGRLMTAVLNGGTLEGAQIFGPATAQALRTPLQKTPLGVNGWPAGLVATPLPGGFRAIGRSGGTLTSRAALSMAPDLRLGVFAASNTETAGPLVDELAGRIVERFYASPRPGLRPGDPALARNAGAYAGRYISTDRAHHGLERVIDRLRPGVRVGVGGDGRLQLRSSGRTRLFSPEFPGLGETPSRFLAADGDEPLVFVVSGGRALSFTPAANTATYTRVGWLLSPDAFFLGALAVTTAALLTLVGVVLRAGRDPRRTDAQAIGSGLQIGVALVWLAAFAAFAIWRRATPGPADLMFRWPGAWLIAASSLALLAFLGSLLSGAQLLELWRTDRRGGGWTRGRRLRHSITAVVFVAYGVLLLLWGALTPWSP